MNMCSTVSIIIPCYNCVRYLSETLESLERQTLRNFEMLLIDDGSSDGSGARCRDGAGRVRRIRLIVKEKQETSCGMPPVKNRLCDFLRRHYPHQVKGSKFDYFLSACCHKLPCFYLRILYIV